jgi:hypothetical protein
VNNVPSGPNTRREHAVSSRSAPTSTADRNARALGSEFDDAGEGAPFGPLHAASSAHSANGKTRETARRCAPMRKVSRRALHRATPLRRPRRP